MVYRIMLIFIAHPAW